MSHRALTNFFACTLRAVLVLLPEATRPAAADGLAAGPGGAAERLREDFAGPHRQALPRTSQTRHKAEPVAAAFFVCPGKPIFIN